MRAIQYAVVDKIWGNDIKWRLEIRGNDIKWCLEIWGNENYLQNPLSFKKIVVPLQSQTILPLMNIIFRRKLYDRMLSWKREKSGQTALLVEGARRVGKTTLVRQFAENEYESYLIIDFNQISDRILHLFDDISNLNYLFLTLQTEFGVKLIERKSIIVFDEVQKCPKARQAIKYLVADGRYDYVETGSLISIRKNVKDITIPSEEERILLNPLDFEEFLWAIGQNALSDLLRQYYEQKVCLGAALRSVMRTTRLYMLVGGMPQAVDCYLTTNNLADVDAVKRGIINLYIEDFNKIDSTGRLAMLYQNIPAQLNGNISRYMTGAVIGRTDEDKTAELLSELEQSRTVLLCHNCTNPMVGMQLCKDLKRYKMYCADTGLFVTMAFWDKEFTDNIIYNKLLSDKLETNLGYVYENLVAQMLHAQGNKLFYHTWQKDERHYYEIDFLLSRANKLVPVEVKSSGYHTHSSIDAFCNKYSNLVSHAVMLYTKDFKRDSLVEMYPVCMTGFV